MSQRLSVIADETLHALARILLRICSPRRACAILAQVGALLPPYNERSDILRAALRVGGRGTCLSRALAVAARAPEAELVIGVAPRTSDRLLAHAWLELSGELIDPSDGAGLEMEQLCRGRLRHMVAGRLSRCFISIGKGV
jgi:hypothetical protein